MRGLRLIQRCPVCLYAGSLVPAEVVAEAPAGARVLDTAAMHLDQIMAEIEAAHAAGQDVARVHSGDPSLYGAIAEQIRRLDALGIAWTITPGVPAFAAAAAALGGELTLPDIAQSVVMTRTAVRASAMPRGREPRRLRRAPAPRLCIHLSINNLAPIVRELTPILGDGHAGGGRLPRHLARPARSCAARSPPSARTVKAAGITRTALIMVGRVLGETRRSARAGSTPPITRTSCGRGCPRAKPSPPAPSPRRPPAAEAGSASPPAAPARAPPPAWHRSARRRWPG